MKRVLVTGASGFIGRHTFAGLLQRGFEIHAISRTNFLDSPDVFWHTADLFNAEQVKEIMQAVEPTHLLHLAWNVDIKTYKESLENFQWVKASLELLEAFQQSGGLRAVMAGTCAEYDWDHGYLSEYTTPRNPRTNYGICKNSLFSLSQAFCNSTGISLAWGRVFFLYGPHENSKRLISSVIQALLGNNYALCTHGEQKRDFLYVEDVANAFDALLDSKVTGPVNIASGEALKIRQIIEIIGELLNKPDLIKLGTIAAAKGDPMLLEADVGRLSQEVCWKPQYSVQEGIEKTISWWRNR